MVVLLVAAWPLSLQAQSEAALPAGQTAQSSAENQVSLGDLARAVRRSKAPLEAPVVIDNDNLSNIMDEVESQRMKLDPVPAKPARGPEFSLSSPDGTCSLSFNASTTSAEVPFIAEDVPAAELAKIIGPATIEGDDMEVSMYNGSGWKLTEITVGLTLTRHVPENDAVYFGSARLMPALADQNDARKPSELTILFHLKGVVPSLGSNVFHEKLGAPLSPDQDWHWAILSAKGIAPAPAAATK